MLCICAASGFGFHDNGHPEQNASVSTQSFMAPTLRIGVDVGGTNTDACLIDPSATASPNRGILSWHKSVTTSNPSHGIENVINALIEHANVDISEIASVTIGTTHFINAVIEKDPSRLDPVAVLRLCGPFSRSIPPGIDWPADLRDLICVYAAFLDGGLEIDGSVIHEPNKAQVEEECARIRSLGIRSIVVNGIFSPADVMGERQEEKVGEWIKSCYPEADVVLSKEVANLGFVERENAAILNASILSFARYTICSFQSAIYHHLGLFCPVFLTQNDGTILKAEDAAKLPIRTFNSGPTNSMCGAAFLVKENVNKESMLVVDIGGTTTDVGMLLASGLPRQASAFTEMAGIRLNFSCPDVKSIGFGGGSIVRVQHDNIAKPTFTIGPDSVGNLINKHALVFGGDVPTTTDYAIVSQEHSQTSIGSKQLAQDKLNRVVKDTDYDLHELLRVYRTTARHKLEDIIDRMKTSAEDVPVLLVGGGAMIVQPSENDEKLTFKGASRVIIPEYAGVANAIGAAMARVSGVVDTVLSTEGRTTQAVLQDVSKIAIERAVTAGAVRDTVEIAEMDTIPIPYVANKCRIIVKAIGEIDFSRVTNTIPSSLEKESSLVSGYSQKFISTNRSTIPSPEPIQPTFDVASYIPTIVPTPGRSSNTEPSLSETSNYEWHLSEVDLEWISVGCYILGTGGGGTPYPHFVRLREMMRKGATVRIVEPGWVGNEDIIACGGAKGSPTVSLEKPPGNEIMEAQNIVYDYLGVKPAAVIALEIGGGNGLQGLILGASTNMNIPTIDGDWMGRAYPVSWQITPVVCEGERALFLPTAISDGNGNHMMMLSATSERQIERAFRAALSEMGSHVGCAKGPCSGKDMKTWVIEYTLSLSWRIGHSIALCRARNDIDHVAEAIIEQVGGKQAAKILFKGKIIEVERKTVKGHSYGEVVISAADVSGNGNGPASASKKATEFTGKLKIPFKNENIVAIAVSDAGVEEVIVSVPDLICVCDALTGEAIGTPEYRYGLLVFVLGIQGSERWTSSARGIEIGGPRAFGIDIDYNPLGKFEKPCSVIEQYMHVVRTNE
ncbi:hypothetical protein F5890DRAFT_1497473 [Lentinula detonsa]|uniref:Hydantoinase n=1 Tax=Lentinula detonsa TaxID=2804962 RepID=A0AA38Q597_9AGAR|nr:hypothetical protein F5890DRAFT_1497473 [Lentinula detonsa]